ncbi:MAG: FliM/FliN family flagellar motor switch protein [Rhodobiaceae bacterium]|nr:FliM/FliN family flagellar motor switch protein [Rhodobiaceae bacterium]
MKPLSKVYVDISVVLGSSTMPIHQLLRMGRGAIIELDTSEKDNVTVMANDVPIAKASVVLQEDTISIEIVEMLTRNDILI